MIVHFVASKSHAKHELRYYKAVLGLIEKAGHVIAYDWVSSANNLIKRDKIETGVWREIDAINEDALKRADVVIIEATAKSFFSGVQASRAVELKKPVLVLTRDTSPLGVSGLTAPTGFIKSKIYTLRTLPAIVEEFLAENIIATNDLRFNFYLDREVYAYLRWVSAKTGRSKAEIIRSLIYKEMQKDVE
ncbi:MAG TPA: hypothetical protein VF733_05390 [Candidatus Saccharimonadales bacterium]